MNRSLKSRLDRLERATDNDPGTDVPPVFWALLDGSVTEGDLTPAERTAADDFLKVAFAGADDAKDWIERAIRETVLASGGSNGPAR